MDIYKYVNKYNSTVVIAPYTIPPVGEIISTGIGTKQKAPNFYS